MASSSANPISTSCQSIASTGTNIAASSLGGGSLRSDNTITHTHYVYGTGSLGRLKYHHKHKSLDASDEELEYSQLSQSTHILGRVKSDRFLASKPDEDRRRRTIIIEKKNDSFGFTLQSYGIHYKRDEEVEMVTYVDYVEYDGPAYKAGMREGDVILSINGKDMEKADHKTLVDFIKSCDTRMRMVVLFEDCVRKVDLHMRYIQLQNLLQSKMNELERVCLRERELLEGKWKTHSLPARKKAITSPSDIDATSSPTDGEIQTLPYYRPTLSTEDVAQIARHQSQQTIIPPPAQFMLTYHYLDPHYRYVLKPSTSNSSGEYFVSIGGDGGLQASPNEQHFILARAESVDTTTATVTATASVNTGTSHYPNSNQQRSAAGQPPAPPPRTCEKHKPPMNNKTQTSQQYEQQQQQQKTEITPKKAHKSGKHCHGHSCNPCIGHFKWKSADKAAALQAGNGNGNDNGIGNGNGNGDNVSLDAYDLASPCCDTHCVPTRRRARHHKEHTHKHKHRERERDAKEQVRPQRPKSQSHVSPGGNSTRHVHHHHHHHDINAEAMNQQPHHHHHIQNQPQQQLQQQQQKSHHGCDSHTSSIRSRYFDLTAGLASHCSLHSCTSSELAPADSTSYTTSLSTDTLYWDPKSDNANSRQHSTKSRQSYQQQQQQPHQLIQQPQQQQSQQPGQQPQTVHMPGTYQQRYHIAATQIQPSQIYPNAAFVHKPKSWDNLTTKAIGGYGFGYGYLDTMTVKPTAQLHIAQQRHSIPRKNPYGRYSTYTDVENYAPPPSQFVEELTTTTTTTITAKSTEELMIEQQNCDCLTKQQQQQQQQQQQALKAAQYHLSQSQKLSHHNTCQMGGYYSHLPRPTTDAGTSTTPPNVTMSNNTANATGGTAAPSTVTTTNGPDVATVSEVTRL